jgi:hypothetical protein
LQRRFEHQGRALADRDTELDRIRTQSRQEITKRRQTEDEMSQVREDLRLATEENRAYRAQRQFDSTAQQDIETRQRTNVWENQNFQPRPQREINSSQNTQGDVPLQSLHGSRQQDQYDPQHWQNQYDSVERGNNRQPLCDRGGGSSSLPTGAADFGYQMLSVLPEATSAATGGPRATQLVEDYPCMMTMQEYYQSLPQSWVVEIPEFGPIKELHKIRFGEHERFAGDHLLYAAWRRRFRAMVHSQRMLVADKAVALSAALDKKQDILAQIVRGLNYDARTYAVLIRELKRLFGGAKAEILLASVDLFKGPKVLLTSLDSVRTFRVKLAAYRTTLGTHGQRAAEFAPNSHLYREIIFSKFTQMDLIHFQEQKATKMWPTSPDGLLAWLDLRQSALEATDIGMRAKTTTQPTVIESLNDGRETSTKGLSRL